MGCAAVSNHTYHSVIGAIDVITTLSVLCVSCTVTVQRYLRRYLKLLTACCMQVCSQELLKLAERRHQVRFVPGKACDGQPHMARLSFAFYQPHELEEGVKRLAAALADYSSGAQ